MRYTDIINMNYKIVKSVILYKLYLTTYLKNHAFIRNIVGGASWERWVWERNSSSGSRGRAAVEVWGEAEASEAVGTM